MKCAENELPEDKVDEDTYDVRSRHEQKESNALNLLLQRSCKAKEIIFYRPRDIFLKTLYNACSFEDMDFS